MLTDDNQQVVWETEYTPFGEANITVEQVENNLRFDGQYFDQETDLHYNHFRYYDPDTGRYIRSDPVGLDGGINPYLYAIANPTKYTDPNGLCPMCLVIPGVCAGGACEAGGLLIAWIMSRIIKLPDGTEVEVDLPEPYKPEDMVCLIEHESKKLPEPPPDERERCIAGVEAAYNRCMSRKDKLPLLCGIIRVAGMVICTYSYSDSGD